jgi:hypothetical protein
MRCRINRCRYNRVRLYLYYILWLIMLCSCYRYRIKKKSTEELIKPTVLLGCPDGAVGTTTRYSLGGPGIESLWGLDFPNQARPAAKPTQVVPDFLPGVKWPGRGGDPPPPSSAGGRFLVSIPLLPSVSA